jgi:predicted site-specific integrase-resolvase
MKRTLLSIRQVARKAGVAYDTALRWVQTGRLRARKLRVKGLKEAWFVRPADLQSLLRKP